MDPSLLQSFEWRSVGPFRGGRVVAVAGDPVDTPVFYFGACAGGVWKTSDGGTYWQNVSDGFFKTASVGALAVSDSDPNVIYAGMGESCIRGDVTHGDGVYGSTDAGKSWTHLGLQDTRHIARIRVHPKNPELVYVAALGHAFGPNDERGVFRSPDGGKNWERVLFRSDKAGAIDLSMDPQNPRILYAAVWQTVRTPWSLESGGPESSLYRSTDAGDTWADMTGRPGWPAGLKGRIGVAVSPARSGRVWAIVEAEEGGLLRSDNGGDTWERVSDDINLRIRPWYYMHVFADPQDAETVYILSGQAWKSTDGGRTFTQMTTPHGDNHDLWIDPRNSRRIVEGNDGGACVSFNGGDSWSTIYNQPTAQFYHLATDTQTPYRVYGTQQDNSAVSVPSRSAKGAIAWTDCYPVGSSESGHIAVRPDNANIVYSGAIGSAPGGGGVLLRYDHSTGQTKIITVWPEVYYGWGAGDLAHRFQWTYPIVVSPHDPGVLYVTGERVFRSADDGQSWEAISPDLTRADASKMGPSGGPVTKDTTGAEHYCTIFAFAESPHEQGVFWAGSDDGLLHCSRDGGKNWVNVTPTDLPEWATISMVEVSPHDPATAYVAAYRYKLDDSRSLLYKTNDYGRNWKAIGIKEPGDDFVRCVREDPSRRGLLYAGGETGIYISLDDGTSWQPFRQNLPVTPVYDLVLKNTDLIAATHGRSFWILDDVTPLHQMSDKVTSGSAFLFQPRPAVRYAPAPSPSRQPVTGKYYQLGTGAIVTFYERSRPEGVERVFLDAGKNPPDGIVVTYYLRQIPESEVTLAILDAAGREIQRFSSQEPEPPSAGAGSRKPRLPARAGTNRFIWDMRYPEARRVAGDATTEQSIVGPLAPPGSYQVQLQVEGATYQQQASIVKDPRVPAEQKDFDEQFALLINIRNKVSETHDAVNLIRSVKQQIEDCERRLQAQLKSAPATAAADAAGTLKQQLSSIEDELIQSRVKAAVDRLNHPIRLNAKLAALTSVVASADGPPTRQSYDVFDHLSHQIDVQRARLRETVDRDIAAFNALVSQAQVDAVVPHLAPPDLPST